VPKVLLSVPHQRQQNDGDCLAACAAMLVTYLGRSLDYARLRQLLNVQPFGAPAGNIRRLAQLNLNVTYSQTDLNGLKAMVQQGRPVIVFVKTGELLHWAYSTDHALVVVGYDDDYLYVNDPDRDETETPLAVPRGDFELAWLERDYYYALITQ
jgi:ABC-type bacteriocin/lantibiotic exporter with double-glycine peptidase domain